MEYYSFLDLIEDIKNNIVLDITSNISKDITPHENENYLVNKV